MNSNKNKEFKVGQKIKHEHFKGEIEIVEVIISSNETYNKKFGCQGILVKDLNGNNYYLWFDTETLRIENRVGETYYRITQI